MRNDRIFIAAPLFNDPQIEIIQNIEDACRAFGYSYYSARRDSESDVPSKENRHKPEAWQPVFSNNVEGMRDCCLCIAVMEYALPYHSKLALVSWGETPDHPDDIKELKLPDTGTVWEASGFWWQGKPVVAYLPDSDGGHLNLMLTHGVDGILKGPAALYRFLNPGTSRVTQELMVKRGYEAPKRLHTSSEWEVFAQFDWTACIRVGAQQGGIEDA